MIVVDEQWLDMQFAYLSGLIDGVFGTHREDDERLAVIKAQISRMQKTLKTEAK